MTYDKNMWRALPVTAHGFTPHVSRRYSLKSFRGFVSPVELIAPHPSLPGWYSVQAVCLDDVYYTPDYVRIDDPGLVPLD